MRFADIQQKEIDPYIGVLGVRVSGVLEDNDPAINIQMDVENLTCTGGQKTVRVCRKRWRTMDEE